MRGPSRHLYRHLSRPLRPSRHSDHASLHSADPAQARLDGNARWQAADARNRSDTPSAIADTPVPAGPCSSLLRSAQRLGAPLADTLLTRRTFEVAKPSGAVSAPCLSSIPADPRQHRPASALLSSHRPPHAQSRQPFVLIPSDAPAIPPFPNFHTPPLVLITCNPSTCPAYSTRTHPRNTHPLHLLPLPPPNPPRPWLLLP